MVTALEDLIAQTATQVCLTLEERAGELRDEITRKTHEGNLNLDATCLTKKLLHLLYKEPERSKDVP